MRVPVLRRDWFIHPLQLCDAKQSGAAGILGCLASVTGGRGTPVLSSFAAALGAGASGSFWWRSGVLLATAAIFLIVPPLPPPAAGMDCPVEVVNMTELRAMADAGVPSYALNVSVGLAVGIAGFGADAAAGLLGELPFGAVSLVGVRSVDEARTARAAGADALLVKGECVAAWAGREAALVAALRDATDGDD